MASADLYPASPFGAAPGRIHDLSHEPALLQAGYRGRAAPERGPPVLQHEREGANGFAGPAPRDLDVTVRLTGAQRDRGQHLVALLSRADRRVARIALHAAVHYKGARTAIGLQVPRVSHGRHHR